MPDSLDLAQATEAFLRGFSIQRSFTRPYVVSQLGPLIWLLHDEEPDPKKGRTAEMVSCDPAPEVVRAAVERGQVGWHSLCVMIPDPEEAPEVVARFKAVGYRARGREPLFAVDTADRVTFDTAAVRRVRTPEGAEAVAAAARHRQLLPQHLEADDAECRLYAAYAGEASDEVIGWVRSIRTHPDRSWVAGLYVEGEHRRKGIGRSLMSAMLADDARLGVRWSVLLASLTGALLYPHLGYRQLGLLLLLSPKR